MLKRGYFLKDAEQEIKNLEQRTAEDNVTQSSATGSFLAESPLDMLKRRAKADIVIQIWWRVNTAGGNKSISFTLEAFDAYTSKRIASSTGTYVPKKKKINAPLPILLEDAVAKRMKEFSKQLDKFYKDISKNGREIILTVRRWENADFNLEKEIDGEEITTHINNWMRQNTVNRQFNLSDASQNFIRFEQVRIPLVDRNGDAMDAREFGRQLQQHLRREPLNIDANLMIRGLGEAILVLGEK